MSTLAVFERIQTQEQAIQHLENIRWNGVPVCPYCSGTHIRRHASSDRAEQRWQCQTCKRTFSVTVGTVFHRTHISLPEWFLILSLVLDPQKPVSAAQIARDMGIRRPTISSMIQRIRLVVANNETQAALLYRVVEMGETLPSG